MSKRTDDLKIRLIVFIAWLVMHIIGFTSRLKIVGYEYFKELLDHDQGFIMAIWHGRTMLPIYTYRGMGIWGITALSKDGEIQTRLINRFGYRTVRGSTNRGGIKAALAAAKKLGEGGILAITPDGPNGPVYKVQDGIIFLAQRANCPILPLGVGIRNQIKASSWDSYALPLPFAKSAIIFGKPIWAKEPEEGNKSLKQVLKEELDRLQREAKLMVGEEA